MPLITALLDALTAALTGLHGLLEPLAGDLAWGFAIVGLTVVVRVALLPLGILQARTVRLRRRLQPEVQRLQGRFDTSDRLRRRNPDRYLQNLRLQQAAIRALHRRHGVRPGVTVGVLLAQSPVLFGLYRVLVSPDAIPLLQAAPFLLIEQLSLSALAGAGAGAVVLLLAVAATTWVSQRQLGRATPSAPAGPGPGAVAAATTGIMTVVAATLPAGLLLYWATAGAWTVAQQAVLLR